MLRMANVIVLLEARGDLLWLFLSSWVRQSVVLPICMGPSASLVDIDMLAKHRSGRHFLCMQVGP